MGSIRVLLLSHIRFQLPRVPTHPGKIEIAPAPTSVRAGAIGDKAAATDLGWA
jgi:hypothetical protein